MLEVEDLTVRIGGTVAVDAVDLLVEPGTVHGLIGPNGAGKTSLFNAVTGVYDASRGRIRYEGRDLLPLPVHARAALGVARTFQNLGLFPSMTVVDNVLCGAYVRGGDSFATAPLRLRANRRYQAEIEKEARAILEQLELSDVAGELVTDLPFGTMKRVEFARALVSRPSLLMLDEPANGLTHFEVDELGTLLSELREEFSLTVLLVEHHMGLVMRLSDAVTVLNAGQRISVGSPEEVQTDERVVAAYLGTGN